MTYVKSNKNDTVDYGEMVPSMSKKKEYDILSEYEIYYVDIKSIMDEQNISQNILSKITDLSINTIRCYYHSNIKRVDLDVISRIAKALNCDINDILKKK